MEIDPAILGDYTGYYQKRLEEKKEERKQQSSILEKSGPSRTRLADNSRKANFAAYYKKTNTKFLQDQEARRQGRTQTMEERRKARRSQVVIAGRRPAICEMTNELNALIYEDSSNEISDLEGSSVNSTVNKDTISGGDTIENSISVKGNSTVSKSVVSGEPNKPKSNGLPKNQNKNPTPPPPTQTKAIKDSRRDQLQKWKKEKQVADSQARLGQKQPFKVGVTKVTGSTTNLKSSNSSIAIGKSTSQVSVSGTSKPAVGPVKTGVVSTARLPSKPTTSNTTNPPVKTAVAAPKKPEEARRVTRAMTKSSQPVAPSAKPVTSRVPAVGSTVATKLPTDKMKALNLNDKPGTKTAVKPATRNAPAVQAHVKNATASLKTVAKSAPSKAPASESETIAPTPAPSSEAVAPEPVLEPQEEKAVVKKKAKPKPLDATYRDYNFRFADACRKLGEFGTQWKTILDEGKDIPDDIRDDIHSFLGKVKLLLDSKLPQFAELLNLYICKDEDDTKIFACDLEGWWDVASIQIEAVYLICEKLTTLKKNGWITTEVKPCPKPARKSATGNLAKKPVVKRAVKAQASSGIRAFMERQRQMLSNNSDDSGTGSSGTITSPEQSEVFVQPEPVAQLPRTPKQSRNVGHVEEDKNFEGGFFSINSPVTPRRRAIRSSILSTSGCISTPKTPISAIPHHRVSGVATEAKRRVSLTMMGVRRSMGALSRIGASALTEKKAEDDNQF